MVAADVTQREALPAPSALLLTAAIISLWAAIAAARPGTTFHLAPVLVALAYPYARWPQARSRRSGLTAALIGTGCALVGATLLHVAGLLHGPTLLGPTALHESVAVALVTGAFTAMVAAARNRNTGRAH